MENYEKSGGAKVILCHFGRVSLFCDVASRVVLIAWTLWISAQQAHCQTLERLQSACGEELGLSETSCYNIAVGIMWDHFVPPEEIIIMGG